MRALDAVGYTDMGEESDGLEGWEVRGFGEGWDRLELPPPPANGSDVALWELGRVRSYLGPHGEFERLRREIERQDRPEEDSTDLTVPSAVEQEFWNLLGPVPKELQVRVAGIAADLTAIGLHYKRRFNRVRPYQLAKLLGQPPLGQLESETARTASYPATHALMGTFLALYLGERYPLQRPQLEMLGRQLGNNRVYAGLHFPSDVLAGRRLAHQLWPLLLRK